MTICNKFKLDESCRKDLEDGYISKGCICCIHSGMNGCRVSLRGRDNAYGKYVSDSGKIVDWDSENLVDNEDKI